MSNFGQSLGLLVLSQTLELPHKLRTRCISITTIVVIGNVSSMLAKLNSLLLVRTVKTIVIGRRLT